jgi:uncharacterized protein
MDYVWAVLLVLCLLVGWCLTLFSMPGNWVMVAAAALYAWLGPVESQTVMALSWWVVLTLLGLAGLGELAELGAGALGAKKTGGSKRGAVLAIVGSFVGSIVGGIVGLPFLPTIVGALVAVVLFAAIGSLAGAMIGEVWKGKGLSETLKVGHAAFWGRILGTMAKVMIASVMVVTGTAPLFF